MQDISAEESSEVPKRFRLFDNSNTFYEILGIPSTATKIEILKAYKKKIFAISSR